MLLPVQRLFLWGKPWWEQLDLKRQFWAGIEEFILFIKFHQSISNCILSLYSAKYTCAKRIHWWLWWVSNVIYMCQDLLLTYTCSLIHKKEQGKDAWNDFIQLHHYQPWPTCCRIVVWVSSLLFSPALICKSCWGTATPLLEIVFQWLRFQH